MRVLQLYAGNLYGGIERLLVTLAEERARDHGLTRHFGLCFPGRLANDLRSAGAPVFDLGAVRFSRPWSVYRARHRLVDLLRREQFDVVICHACWPHALFSPVVRAAGVPLVYWAHDVAKGTHWTERRAARTPPDLVIANSRFTKSSMGMLFPAVRTEVVYHPLISPERLNCDFRERVREELGTSLNEIVIVIACRLERWKGHAILLEALARLRALPGWQCWIIGGVQRSHERVYLTELMALATRENIMGRVRFLGQRSDVSHLLLGADIHCQPNTGPEPFGVAFIEAMHAGLPVVTTTIGAAPEIITPECGILVPPGDASAVAEALRELILDPVRRQTLAAAGPARANAMCNVDVQLAMLNSLLIELSVGGSVA